MIDIRKIRTEISNRHVHLSKEHLDVLFGRSYELGRYRELSQPEQFAAHERVALVNGDNGRRLDNVRVLGPVRDKTQVEISRTDAIFLKLNVPLKLSGDLDESIGILIRGPKGVVRLDKGVIISQRHLHISDVEAEEIGLKDNQIVSIRIPGVKGVVFSNVVVRVGSGYRLSFHIDCDEGNACFFEEGVFSELILD